MINTADLRALADFLDEHPALAARMAAHEFNVFAVDETEWTAFRAVLGSYSKGARFGFLEATRSFGGLNLIVNLSQEKSCQRVKVGEQIVEREVYPDDVQPTIETVVEPVYEWVCPESWLAPA